MLIPHFPDEWLRGILSVYYETDDREIHGIGNAAIILARGDRALALTAAHVAEEVGRVAARDSPFRDLSSARSASLNFRSRVNTMLGERHCGGEQDIVLIPEAGPPTYGGYDIATLHVQRAPSGRFPLEHYFGLKLVPPQVGDMVCAIGCQGYERRPELDSNEAAHMFEAQQRVIPARVTSATCEGQSLAPGPVFEVDADFEPGLSGAPVVMIRDERLLLCGLVCTGGAVSGRATVAAIWPSLALDVSERVQGQTESRRTTLFELAQRSIVGSIHSELQRFSMRDEGIIYLPG